MKSWRLSMQAEKILEEIKELYGEWLEHAGDRSDELLINILAQEIAVQKSIKECYKRRLDYVSNDPGHRRMASI